MHKQFSKDEIRMVKTKYEKPFNNFSHPGKCKLKYRWDLTHPIKIQITTNVEDGVQKAEENFYTGGRNIN